MSERLSISKGWLSRMLKVATIPEPVLAAFASVNDLTMKPGYSLAQALDNKAATKAITVAAKQIAKEQASRLGAGTPALPASEVLRRLLEAPHANHEGKPAKPFAFASRLGRTALTVQSANRQGVAVRLRAGGAEIDELVTGLREALAHLQAIGRGLRR